MLVPLSGFRCSRLASSARRPLLATLSLLLSRFPEAEASLKQAERAKPPYPPLYVLLANGYLVQQKPAEALSELQTLLTLLPDGPFSQQVRQKIEVIERSFK